MALPSSEKDIEQALEKVVARLLPGILKDRNNTVRNGVVSSVNPSSGQVDMRMIGSGEVLPNLRYVSNGDFTVGAKGLVLSSDPNVKSANFAIIFTNGGVVGRPLSLSGNIMQNGQISVSVTSNNLSVSLRGENGAVLSESNKLGVTVAGAHRTIGADKTLALAAGTSWFGSGASELAANLVQYFVYIVWNTTPTFSRADLIVSRIPWATTYGDFSSTSTNERYGAFTGSDTPQSTNKVVLVGRFDATLSAAASHNWSISGTGNVINTPIFQTDTLVWTPTISVSGGTAPTYTAVFVNKYQIIGKMFFYNFFWQNVTGGTAGSGTNGIIFTVPMAVGGGLSQGSTIGTGYSFEGSAGTQRGVFTRLFTSSNAVSIDYAAGTLTVIAGNDQSDAIRIISINGQYAIA